MAKIQEKSKRYTDREKACTEQIDTIEKRLLNGRNALPLTPKECKLIMETPGLLVRVARVLAAINIDILLIESLGSNAEFENGTKLLELIFALTGRGKKSDMERWMDPKQNPKVATNLSIGKLEKLSIKVKSSETTARERRRIQKQLIIIGEIIDGRKSTYGAIPLIDIHNAHINERGNIVIHTSVPTKKVTDKKW